MPEQTPEPIERITAEFVHDDCLVQEALCERLGISEDMFVRCLQWEIIRPLRADPLEPLLFSQHEIDRLCRGLRLHRDLGLNWPGVSVALDLLDRIEEIERQLGQNDTPIP